MNAHNDKKSSVRKIECNDRGFIYEMYMDATLTVCLKVSFAVYAIIMNQKAEKSTHGPELLHISYQQLNTWYLDNGGREYTPIDKPLDTDVHQEKSREQIREHYPRNYNLCVYICYLDKK